MGQHFHREQGYLGAPYLLTVTVFPSTYLISKGFEKWNVFLPKQHAFYFISDPVAVPYLLQSMARDKADGRRSDLPRKMDPAFG